MGFITNLHHWLTSLGGATFVEWMFFFWGGYWENPAPIFFTVRRWLRHQRFSGPTWDTWCAGTKRADLTQHERRISYVSWSKVGLNNYSYHICRLSIHLLGILIVLYTNIYIYIYISRNPMTTMVGWAYDRLRVQSMSFWYWYWTEDNLSTFGSW